MAELEEELQSQLAEQQEALEGVRQLLAADPGCAETAALLEELQGGMRDTEEALLGLKRQRLLLELDALQSGGPGGGGRQQQQQGQQGQEQQQQQGQEQQQGQQQQQQQQQGQGQGQGGGQGGGGGAEQSGARLPPGTICVFRHTDGRHYFGRVLEVAGIAADGVDVQLQFVHPTRPFQLEPLALSPAALHPGPAGGLPCPAPQQLHAGLRVLVRTAGGQLWQAAEVAEVGVQREQVVAVTLADQRRHVLPLTAVALSAHAPDPHGGGSDEDDGVHGGGGPPAAGYDGGGGGGESGGSAYSSSGSDMEFSDEGDEEEEAAGFDGACFGRVSLAVAEAAGLAAQQAAAGRQTDTSLFFASEAHSRGIGSKLLAKMGFRGHGHGLGRQQQGMQQALLATQLKRGAGLGVDSGGGTREGASKKQRSGKQRRRDKAAKAGLEQREAQRAEQRRLEAQTGSEGLFAVLNSIIGDSSGAQAVKEANLGMCSSSCAADAAAGGSSRQGHLFGAGSGGGSGSKKAAPKQEESRQSLVRQTEHIAQLRQKVQRLREMAQRNANDKGMAPQIRRALAEAQAQLAAAEAQHSASTKAIHDKEKMRKYMKF